MSAGSADHSVNNSQDYDYGNVTYLTDQPVTSIYTATPAVVAVLAVFYGSISLLALCGNGLVVLIIASNKRMQSVTNFLLANLASSDILIAVAAVPFQFQAALLQRWVLPDFMCILAPFVQVLSVNVSIFTLTVISIERYRALLYPFKSRITKSVAGYAIAVIWTIGILSAAPMAVTLRVVDMGDPVHGSRPFCFPAGLAFPDNDTRTAQEEAWDRSLGLFQGYVVFLVAFQFIIPLTIIGFAYITIAMHLWGAQGPGEQNQQHIYRIKLRKKVIKMLILVVVLFALCWMPLQTYNLLTVALPRINEYRYINLIWFCCNFLAMSNSCQNPFILGFYNEKFRNELRSKFRLCFCLRRSRPRRAGTTFTRTTRGETEVGDQTLGYTITRMERVKQSGKRHANHSRISDDSPIYGNIKVPLDPADYYD